MRTLKLIGIFSIFCLCPLSIAQAFIANDLFEKPSAGEEFAPSFRGYGFIPPKGHSELQMLTSFKLMCRDYSQQDSIKEEQVGPALKEHFKLLTLMTLLRRPQASLENLACIPDESWLQEAKSYQSLLSNSKFYYNKKKKGEIIEKMHSRHDKYWSKVDKSLKNYATKREHLKLKIDKKENLAALLLLDYLSLKNLSEVYSPSIESFNCEEEGGVSLENDCIDQFNTFQDVKRSFFLLKNRDLTHQTREFIKLIMGSDGETYEKKLVQVKHPKQLADIKAEIESDLKRINRGRETERKEKALSSLNDILDKKVSVFVEELEEGLCQKNPHLLAVLQTLEKDEKGRVDFAKQKVCSKKSFLGPVEQCAGVRKYGRQTKVFAPFFSQGFRADRDFSIKKTHRYSYRVEALLEFQFEDRLSEKRSQQQLRTWEKEANEFYNSQAKRLYSQGKTPYRVHFDIKLRPAKGHNQAINLRRCWVARYQTNQCGMSNQPDGNNFTIDMSKDALFEEIGHHMGLFDEYSTSYYVFNAQGARESFMVADEDYKLRKEHLSQILAPHFLCGETQ